MALSLDAYAVQLAGKNKLSLKLKERALLRTALYQHLYMSRIPLFAIVNETVEIAKMRCHTTTAAFFNHLLRKMQDVPLSLPQGATPHAISLRTSYPEYFVQLLLKQYPVEKVIEILETGNKPPQVTLRVRPQADQGFYQEPAFSWISEAPPVVRLNETQRLTEIALRKDAYIQNWTPAYLMDRLCNASSQAPTAILDLCAAPGGKLLAVHDHFPKAKLFANDVSAEKMAQIEENCAKYGIEATLSCQRGEEFSSADKFDLIILDAPCSNTGVLNKRAEARWRLNKESVEAHAALQKKLLKHAASLLKSGGELWYLTCSILPEENQEVARSLGLSLHSETLILPTPDGKDGGYAVCLKAG